VWQISHGIENLTILFNKAYKTAYEWIGKEPGIDASYQKSENFKFIWLLDATKKTLER